MKIFLLSNFFLVLLASALPELPSLIEHPPVAYRLGDLNEKILTALKKETYHCTIRDDKGGVVKFYLDYSKRPVIPNKVAPLEMTLMIKRSRDILEKALPASNLKGAELVDFTRILGNQKSGGVWIFQYIVKDFTPAGGLGYFPTVIIGLNSKGEYLGRFDKVKTKTD